MSKSLEALKNLYHNIGNSTENYLIIENALKKLKSYENNTTFTMVNQINALRDENEELIKRLNEMYELREHYHLDQKKLKAYEIIIENDIRISDFKIFNTFASFNQRRSLIGLRTISKEKYDVLKEVLLCQE